MPQQGLTQPHIKDIVVELGDTVEALMMDINMDYIHQTGDMIFQLLDRLCSLLDIDEQAIDKAEQKASGRKWVEWLDDALHAGAGRAHRWTKVPDKWTPTTVALGAGGQTATPDGLLHKEVQQLAGLW